ncbi:MAG: secretin N-terminal domain-containing protein, partial [Gemmatimonadales bacterium]
MEPYGKNPMVKRLSALFLCALVSESIVASPLGAQDTSRIKSVGDSVVIRLVDTDLRAAISAMSHYLPKTVLATNIPALRITLEPPAAVSREGVALLLEGLVEANGLKFIEDSAYYRIEPAPPEVPAAAEPSKPAAPVQLFVIRLKHGRAAEVAATINLLFGGSGAFAGSGGLSGGTLADELRRNQVVPQDLREAPAPVPGVAAGPVSALSGAVTIVPDELTNSLLIRASEEDFGVIEEAVEYLDIRPLQVLIEILIVEARKDRNFSLGADLFLPEQSLDGGTVEGRLTGGGLGDLVIRLMS